MAEFVKLSTECKSDNLAREPFKATKIWNELVEHLRANVEQRRRRWKFQYYENCFRGVDVVEVLHCYVQSNPHLSKDATRDQVKCLCQILLEKRVIECVTIEDKTKSHSFEDGSKLYRFSSLNQVISSPSQSEKKRGRRGSLLGERDNNTSRRKSLRFTPKSQKRFADLLMSESTRWPDTNFTRPQKSWNKRRRLSLDAGLNLRKNKMAMLSSESGSSRDFISQVWFEVALSQLLQLTEVPFLEDVLASPSTDDDMGVVVMSNDIPEHWKENSNHKENIGSESGDVWVQAGMECIQLQTDFPLPHCSEMSYINLANAKEAEIQQLLLEYYGSLEDSLIPANLVDLVNGMLCTLANDWSKIKSLLPLLALTLPLCQRKHLKKLLNFIGMSADRSSGRFIIKRFTSAILPKDIKDKASGQRLVSLMVCHQQQMFTIPTPVKELFQNSVFSLKQGMCPTLTSKISKQLSIEEYQQQKLQTTNESLSDLMTFIVDNLHMSLKEKEERLKLFQKHHNDVFLWQFPDGNL
ncbi:DEP domain-containing protein 7-like [Montipora foliosa]|uniref:DEP domain-containing protein 7-like n=1 Tax=Montipora foliosa TaxID=591990 RepID=UPI0035F1273C